MKYELTVVCGEKASEEARDAVDAKIKKIVEKSKGTLAAQPWGKKLLAYDMDEQRSGFFTMYELDVAAEVPAQIEKELRITEAVLRWLVIKPTAPVVINGKALKDFAADEPIAVDYKTPDLLVKFVTERGKILPRRLSRLNAKAQREIAREVKRARMLGLLPFTSMGQ